jgi:hypothetical protein
MVKTVHVSLLIRAQPKVTYVPMSQTCHPILHNDRVRTRVTRGALFSTRRDGMFVHLSWSNDLSISITFCSGKYLRLQLCPTCQPLCCSPQVNNYTSAYHLPGMASNPNSENAAGELESAQLRLRSYQLEMYEESLKGNTVVAVSSSLSILRASS